ncbi:hypothetical protein B0H19DRAFT_1056970 [Mycena capillaripes]|nr:hypothetical protein B0H19DRAFT_1056970 [Mycena capillaripes]
MLQSSVVAARGRVQPNALDDSRLRLTRLEGNPLFGSEFYAQIQQALNGTFAAPVAAFIHGFILRICAWTEAIVIDIKDWQRESIKRDASGIPSGTGIRLSVQLPAFPLVLVHSVCTGTLSSVISQLQSMHVARLADNLHQTRTTMIINYGHFTQVLRLPFQVGAIVISFR